MNFSLNLKWLEQSGWLVKVSPSKSIQQASLTYFSSHSCYLLPSAPVPRPRPWSRRGVGSLGGGGILQVLVSIRGCTSLSEGRVYSIRGGGSGGGSYVGAPGSVSSRWLPCGSRGNVGWVGLLWVYVRRNVEMLGSCRYWVCWSLQVLTSSPSGITCNS